ncbi:hypothetical protein [Methylophaga sp.]|uniref:hypothetical protein n=1 Tax=Methylophaga sp. TaxID=2024840 RepID=UPI0014000492|nr:hypothetical protein [Methylophaga sp.]MTI64811.1 hypothetical protein [Methylophaga sp.]
MSPQQQDTSTSQIAARLWVMCFALLLASLPVISYAKTGSTFSSTGLVKQLEARIALHDNSLRLCLKSEQSEQTSADAGSPDWHPVNDGWHDRFQDHNTVSSLTEIVSAEFSASAYLRPYLRAPPLS